MEDIVDDSRLKEGTVGVTVVDREIPELGFRKSTPDGHHNARQRIALMQSKKKSGCLVGLMEDQHDAGA